MPSLDLGANSFRQNGSIKDDHALVLPNCAKCSKSIWTPRDVKLCDTGLSIFDYSAGF